MATLHAQAADIEVRALNREEELDVFLRLSHAAFAAEEEPARYAEVWRHRLDHWPAVQSPDSVRGAVDRATGEVLGAYVLLQRTICIGPARVPMGGVSAVCVDETRRKQGVGAALMWDAVDYARTHGMALLLLTGVPNYYHRFDYVPVLDLTELFLDRSAVQALPADDSIRVRTATPDDAEALLTLYLRQFQPLIGGSARTLAAQQYRLARPHQKAEHLLALDAGGTPAGYLILYKSQEGLVGVEVAADDWPTTAALLRAHNAYLPAGDAVDEAPVRELAWSVPPGTPLFYDLSAHMPFRSERLHHPSADWMARVGDVDALLQAMTPAWHARLADSHQPWRGRLRLVVDGHAVVLRLRDTDVTLGDDVPGAAMATVQLSARALIQLCFGYRPVWWFARQADATIPAELLPLLHVLFPSGTAWVAASDAF